MGIEEGRRYQPDVGGIEHESSWKENAAESVRTVFLYFCNGNCSCCIGDSIVPHVLYIVIALPVISNMVNQGL